MLARRAYSAMLTWKNGPGKKKALLVTGARQVGKTALIRAFGRGHYASFWDIDFVARPEAALVFRKARDAENIFQGLEVLTGVAPVFGKTLLFLDEIQECPEARSAVRTIVNDGRVDCILSGSLLGLRTQLPPGLTPCSEQTLHLHPLDIAEFLLANGIGADVLAHVRRAFLAEKPVRPEIHEALSRFFRRYLVLGGMPGVVAASLTTNDMGEVVAMQRGILALLRLEAGRYAKDGGELARALFDDVPCLPGEAAPLSDGQRRAFVSLADAGIILPCRAVDAPQSPLRLREKRDAIRPYLCDTGLLYALCRENMQAEVLSGSIGGMRRLLENAVAQNLSAAGFPLWRLSAHGSRADFLIRMDGGIIPIRLPPGENGTERISPLAGATATADALRGEKTYELGDGNLHRDGTTVHLPWYMAALFTPDAVRPMPVEEVPALS
ncbi:MAG: AAA family ATPase [Desulfovibrio sp.]|nr:AAA family ATPase [Desulfovibrio sp.]